MIQIVKTFLIGLLGGGIFTLLHIPLSWMLGSITAVFFANKWLKTQLVWPVYFRNIGLIIIGYTIGHSFSKQTVIEIGMQLPSMLVMTISVILFSAVLAYVTSKWTGINLQSTLTGNIPGGLSQMVVLGEETEGVDLTVVTIIQVIRLISVIIVVPFLVFSPLLYGSAGGGGVVSGSGHAFTNFDWKIILYLVVAWGAAEFAHRFRFPTPFLIGPIIGIGALMVFNFQIPILPGPLLMLSQVFLGIYFSFMMDIKNAKNLTKFISISVVTTLFLLLFSMGLSILLMYWHDIPFLSAFISMAPGGMAEMALVGQAVHAELSIITAYHLFRILFILFVVPFALRKVFQLPYFQKSAKAD
jgi:uncharacterized protein